MAVVQRFTFTLPVDAIDGIGEGTDEAEVTLDREATESLCKDLAISLGLELVDPRVRPVRAASWQPDPMLVDDDGFEQEDELVPQPGARSVEEDLAMRQVLAAQMRREAAPRPAGGSGFSSIGSGTG